MAKKPRYKLLEKADVSFRRSSKYDVLFEMLKIADFGKVIVVSDLRDADDDEFYRAPRRLSMALRSARKSGIIPDTDECRYVVRVTEDMQLVVVVEEPK